MARKVIGLITAAPESNYGRRLIDGLSKRCNAYGYDLAVVCSMSTVVYSHEKYRAGEMNIYRLINYDRLDGLVVDAISIHDDKDFDIVPEIEQLLDRNPGKPIVAFGGPIRDFPYFMPKDRPSMQLITAHVLETHGCRKTIFLGGPEGHPDTESRLEAYRHTLLKYGLEADASQVFYGDFWYTGGAALAKKILSGQVEKPEAVICASDHMAIGLANALVAGGIRVPEDVIVIGFDDTQDAAVNGIPITTIPSDASISSAKAVDLLRSQIEPGSEMLPIEKPDEKTIRTGLSCGCSHDMRLTMDLLKPSLYMVNHDNTHGDPDVDIGILLESHMVEYLSDTETPEECIYEIYRFGYLLGPYGDFFLCLDENWLDAEQCCAVGYPDRIRMMIHRTSEVASGYYKDGPVFETAQMLPQLGSEEYPPSAYVFMPVHFLDQSMGYAVVRYDLKTGAEVTFLTRNWLQNVNTGLEISRSMNKLKSMSVMDGMTGAYNRRGMEVKLRRMQQHARPGDSVLAFVIDMDRLKYVNDSFGHTEGDWCIAEVCNAAMSLCDPGEICVRAGGDEFYVIGIGEYAPDEPEKRMRRFDAAMEKANRKRQLPFTLSASIGSVLIPLSAGMEIMSIIRIADVKMYENKARNKMQRID